MKRYVTHLESALDGTRLPPDALHTTHADRPLWVRYDLPAVRAALSKSELAARPPGMFRWRELLPVGTAIEPVTLGEGSTPLLPAPRLGEALGLRDLWIKDESVQPGGSFKCRGLAMAVTMARHFGVRRVALPTAGNAGGAAALYAARAGMPCYVFMPEDTPVLNQYECALAGARTFLVNGLITDCGRLVREGAPHLGWFDLSTLREPYRLEGKKTLGLELAEQFDWRPPDVVLYPTGGGTGLLGIWKAFEELAALGWLAEDRRPKMVAVQSSGCAPIVRAFESGQRFAAPWENARTIASGLRVPAAVGDFMMLDLIRASGGCAVAVPDEGIRGWMRQAARLEGLAMAPEPAVCIGAAQRLRAEGWLQPDDRVVIINTGAAQKYPEVLAAELPRLDVTRPIDWQVLADA